MTGSPVYRASTAEARFVFAGIPSHFSRVFPYRDDNPTELTPYVTVGLIGLNVLVWVLVQGMGSPETLAHSVCTLGLIPGELLRTVPPHTVVHLGEGLACATTSHPA